MPTFIIGVAGGSGSGKTTVTEHIVHAIGADKVSILRQDYYYKNLSDINIDERREINFDHPEAFDWLLFTQHVNDLYNGLPVEMTTYDFAKDNRNEDTVLIKPAQVVVVEGIFALSDEALRKLMAVRIFVDTSADIRFIRRLKRDTENRGRTTESVVRQYLEQVRPMHNEFIEPTKYYSHIIIPHGANKAALEMIVARIKGVLNNEILDECKYFDEE